MNNLVLINSVICTINEPLSYTNTRSIYTHEERFLHTQKTIESIKKNIPNSKILIVECSELNEEQNNYLIQNSDYFLNLYNNEQIRKNVQSNSKSLGEGSMTHCAIEYILSNNIIFDNFIKISGRYWLSDNFNYNNFDNTNIVIKYIDVDHISISTVLYKLPRDYIIQFKLFLECNFHEMINCIGYEVLFAIFIKSLNTNNILILDKFGVEGHISVSTDFYSG